MERVVKSIIRAYTVNPLRTVIKGSWGPWEIVPLFHTLHRLQRSFGGSSRRKERIRLWVVRSVRHISDGYFGDIDYRAGTHSLLQLDWNSTLELLHFICILFHFSAFICIWRCFSSFDISPFTILVWDICAVRFQKLYYIIKKPTGISAELVLTATRMRLRKASYRTP